LLLFVHKKKPSLSLRHSFSVAAPAVRSPAQRRLRHVQALGGAPEMQSLGDGDKAAGLGELEYCYSFYIDWCCLWLGRANMS
jgi:hypothetical protein